MEEAPQNNAKSNDDWQCQRGEGGRWVSTSGRPVGTRNKATKASVAAISSLQDLAFTKLRELLEAGHPGIVEFTVKSLLPAGGRAVQLESLDADGLLDAVSSGTISPTELRQIAAGIEKIRNVESLAIVQERLAQIEKLLQDGSL